MPVSVYSAEELPDLGWLLALLRKPRAQLHAGFKRVRRPGAPSDDLVDVFLDVDERRFHDATMAGHWLAGRKQGTAGPADNLESLCPIITTCAQLNRRACLFTLFLDQFAPAPPSNCSIKLVE